MKKSLGIYIHIPFCLAKCRYCDFCSFPSTDGADKQKYTDELCRRISEVRADDCAVDTVYFGGGTPSLLTSEQIAQIISAVRKSFSLCECAEITLECNPATAKLDYFREIRALGVNRLSMGLQSAHDNELAALGRLHTVRDFADCFEQARKAGFDNISADLMYGIPEQTAGNFAESIDFLASLSPEHISAYGLTVEEGTYFYRHRDSLNIADGDGQADMYLLLCRRLAEHGYERYEISNFSKRNRRSRHNTRYWQCGEYLGFGVAAHSYFGGERFGNSRDIAAFLRGEDIVCEREVITQEAARSEYVMLGLRLSEGIDTNEYAERFGSCFDKDFDVSSFIGGGFMRRNGSRIAFTDSGFLVSNAILAEILP